MELNEFIPKDGKPRGIYCDDCSANMTLVFDNFEDILSGVSFSISNLPYLYCKDCDKKYLPDRSRVEIVELHKKAIEKGSAQCICERQKRLSNFEFTSIPFKYDADDHYYFPGLTRPWDDGFLTPVFFNKAVLLKFQNHTDYKVSFASKTYGTIYMKDDYISFGLNRAGKVVMWLGDLAKLSEKEQYYLVSENVESDHDLGSKFYDGQIEVKFTDPSPEDQLVSTRQDFIDFFRKEFGHELVQLTDETLVAISELNPPVLHTNKEQKDIADLLNKINIEALNSDGIGKALKESGGDPKSMGALKRLENVLKIRFPKEGISKLISPLFVMYDLRICLLHSMSIDKKNVLMAFICNRLNLAEDSDFEAIYPVLISELTESYKKRECPIFCV